MRIDPAQSAVLASQRGLSLRRAPAPPTAFPGDSSGREPAQAAPLPPQRQVSVSIDNQKNLILQFLDGRTGELIQQVPPEELLRVMRNIADLLRQSEPTLKITV